MKYKIQRLIYVTTALGVNTRDLILIYLYNTTYIEILPNISSNEHPNLHTCDFNGPKQYVRPLPLLTTFNRIPPYVQSDSIGCSSNLEKPHWPN
jgi:hypothetical protein